MANTPMVRKNFMDQEVVVIPFTYADGGGPAAEVDTGFVIPQNSIIYPDEIFILVDTADSGKTIDVGILSTQSGGDANGLLAGVSLTTTGMISPVVTVTQGTNAQYISATTFGVLFLPAAYMGANTAGHGAVPRLKPFVSKSTAGQNISFTVSSGAAAAKGRIVFRVHCFPI